MSGAGGGAITVAGLDNSILRSGNPINTSNISTYIATGAINTAYIANAAITNALIADATIATAKIANAAITSAKIGTAEVATLNLAGQAVTIPSSAYTAGSVSIPGTLQSTTFTSTGAPVFITISFSFSGRPSDTGTPWNYLGFSIKKDGTTIYSGKAPFSLPDVIGNQFGNAAAAITDTPTSGAHTYSITADDPASGGGSSSATNISIMCLEVKR